VPVPAMVSPSVHIRPPRSLWTKRSPSPLPAFGDHNRSRVRGFPRANPAHRRTVPCAQYSGTSKGHWCTGSSASPVAVLPLRTFRLTVGFADHDVRFGSSAWIRVQQEIAPAREEAGKMIWPAIWKVTQKALCDGDWRPPLSWLDVTELLDGPSG
jgi:hypothetical protein